ncbi:MAG: type IV secretion system protein [Microthrixaceae bacterium]|nr:type IV secretion system protein [Microthrixaceae bacterium]
MILGIGFPNPIGWAIDKVTGFVGGVATAGFEMIIGGLVAWVVDAVVWVVGGVFNFFLDSTDPNVQADWFITGDGPYATTVGIGASLLLLFVLAGIVQGTLSGDVGGMLRRMGLELPISIIGMVGLVTVTQILVQLTDALSGEVLGNFQDDISEFGAVVATLSHLNGGTSTAFVVFVLGLVTVLAGLILVAELVVRSALIYIVVALAPLVFAARLWPATRGASRKLLDLLVALIVSKLVIAIALSVAAAAAVGAGSGGEVTALPEPEVFAEDPGGSVTQAVGILLTAAAAFGVSAFSPLLIARLLPLTEGALVAQGVKGGPVRAGQQGMMAANTVQMVSGRRYSQIANGKAAASGANGSALPAGGGGAAVSKAGATGGAGGGAAAGGAGAAGAAAGPVAVAVVGAQAAAKGVKKGASAATGTAEAASDASDAGSSSGSGSSGPAQRRPERLARPPGSGRNGQGPQRGGQPDAS